MHPRQSAHNRTGRSQQQRPPVIALPRSMTQSSRLPLNEKTLASAEHESNEMRNPHPRIAIVNRKGACEWSRLAGVHSSRRFNLWQAFKPDMKILRKYERLLVMFDRTKFFCSNGRIQRSPAESDQRQRLLHRIG